MAKAAKNEDMLPQDDDGIESIINFSEDINDAEAPVPLPERDYSAEITKVDVKTSNTSGKKFAQIAWRIAEEDYPADYPAENAPGGTTVQTMVMLEDDIASRYRLKGFLEAIGAPKGKQIRPKEWVNLRGRVTVKHETYEGVTRAKGAKVAAE